MTLTNSNSYAFDECSALKLCKIDVPESFQLFFGKVIKPKNHDVIKGLTDALDQQEINRKLFIPSNLRHNSIKSTNEILTNLGHVQMLGKTFKAEVLKQIEDFCDTLSDNFEFINKSENINSIKQIFINNEREMTRPDKSNIPEDDDLKIISGYKDIKCTGIKYLITEDEHFWGYTDIIQNNFTISVVKEWECNILI